VTVATGVVAVDELDRLKVPLEELEEVLAGSEVGTAPLSPPSSDPVLAQRPLQSVVPGVLVGLVVSEPVELALEPVVLVWEPRELVVPCEPV
jgi:hypothetical protein